MPAFSVVSDLLSQTPALVPAGASLALLSGAVLARRIAARRLAPAAAGPVAGAARRRLRLVRGVCGALLALGLGLLWQGEIHTVALQLAALTMAIVMAGKELILCLTGSMLRIGGGLYRIGDLVEIDGTLGEVTDATLLVTHIAEMRVDAFGRRATGRSRAIPNSRLFQAEVQVERLGADVLFHAFSITLAADADAPRALEILEAAATRAGRPFALEVAAAREQAGRRLHQTWTDGEARVAMATTEMGLPRFDILLLCPASAVHGAERAIRLELARQLAERPAARPSSGEGLRLVAG